MRGDVVGIVAGQAVVDHHGVGAHDVEEELGWEPGAVVLAQPHQVGGGKEAVECGLVLYEPLCPAVAVEGPSHLAGDPQGGEPGGLGRARGLAQEADHVPWVEAGVLKVGLVCAGHLQGAAPEGGIDVDAVAAHGRHCGIDICPIDDVQAPLSALKPGADEGQGTG